MRCFITRQKINRAKFMLSATVLPIEKVSKSFFLNSKHFMYAFKEYTGVTSSFYRKIYSGIHMNLTNVSSKSPNL